MAKDEAKEQSPEEQDSIEVSIEEEATDESFLDSWMRKSLNDNHLDDDILDLIKAHLDGTSLDEGSLYDALVNYADDKIENNE